MRLIYIKLQTHFIISIHFFDSKTSLTNQKTVSKIFLHVLHLGKLLFMHIALIEYNLDYYGKNLLALANHPYGTFTSTFFYLIFIYILCLTMQEKKTTIICKNTLTFGSHIFRNFHHKIWTFDIKNTINYKRYSKKHRIIRCFSFIFTKIKFLINLVLKLIHSKYHLIL